MSATIILFAGAMPPPITGQSLVNQQVVSALHPHCQLIVLDLSPRSLKRSVVYHLRRLLRTCTAIITILSKRRGRLYLSTDSGLGLFYNIAIALSARLARHSIFLHHHSFSYIERRSPLMAMLVAVAGRDATHIFYCDVMRNRFKDEYAFDGSSFVCSTARSAPPKISTNKMFKGERPFRVGLLSNLNTEKGLYDFISLLREAKERMLPIYGILAGPPVSQADAEAITAAQQELGARLDFRGPLYGEAKDAFYDEIDVFLFPTRYRIESYGLVLSEALAHGVPVISYVRGCIESYVEGDGGYLIAPDADFVTNALVHLERWLTEPSVYEVARVAAGKLGQKIYDQAERDFLNLISLVAEPIAEPLALRARS
jgi:glycosyltransferase involved in cell wall biosynthesis